MDRRRLPDAEDVLDGRESATIETLFALIGRVNPTGRGLSASEEERRYAVKSRLQSLLIRVHADVLEFVPDPRDPSIVSIRHRYAGRDACHVRVAGLDADARFVVEAAQGCDAVRPALEGPDGGRFPTGREDLLARGAHALAEYDYDLARECFHEELVRSGGSARAAVALLDLLVDTLGLDSDALDVVPLLDRGARADGAVRAFLGLAAARSGDAAAAEGWLTGVHGAAAASAWAHLAQSALDAHELGPASVRAGRLRDLDPTNPGLAGLEAAIRQARGQERAPDEAMLQRLVDEDRWDEAKATAGALLARWPDSDVARSVLARVRVRRERALTESLLAGAARAEEADDLPRAVQLLRRARSLGGLPSEVDARIETLEEAWRARVCQLEVEAALAALEGPDLPAALTRCAALRGRTWEDLRARSSREEIAWLGEVPERVRAQRPGDVASALMALAEARGLADSPGARRGLALLDAHADVLESVREAKRARDRLHRTVSANAAAETRALLDSLLTDLCEGRASSVLDRLRSLDLGDVDPAEGSLLRREIGALEGEARSALDVARFQALLAGSDVLAARSFAADRAKSDPAWRARLDLACESVRRTFRMTVIPGDQVPADLRDHRFVQHTHSPHVWLAAGGRTLFVAGTLERWVFVRRCQVDPLRVIDVLVLRTPVAIGMPDIQVQGGRLWIMGPRHWLVLECDPWDIAGWYEIDAIAESSVVPTHVLVPGTPYLWTSAGEDGRDGPCRVVDTGTWSIADAVGPCIVATQLVGSDPPVVARWLTSGRIEFHSPRGRRASGMVALGCPVPSAVSAGPGGQGVAILIANSGSDGMRLPGDLRFVYGEAGAADPAPKVLNGAERTRDHFLAASRATGLLYVSARSATDEAFVLAFERQGTLLVERWRSAICPRCVLIQSEDGRHVVAFGFGNRRAWTIPLGIDPPPLDPTWTDSPEGWPAMDPPFSFLEDGKVKDRMFPYLKQLAELDASGRLTFGRTMLESESRPDRLADIGNALRTAGEESAGLDMLERASAIHTRNPFLRLSLAYALSEKRSWARVLDLLDHDTLAGLSMTNKGLALALIGISRLRLCDLPGAVTAWREGKALGDVLNGIDSYIAFGEELIDAPGAEARLALFPMVTSHVRALREADRALDRGDTTAAARALDIRPVWMFAEVQGIARLAATWLDVEPQTPGEWFRKVVALAAACEDLSETSDLPDRQIRLGPFEWGAERIAGVVSRAHAWLESAVWP